MGKTALVTGAAGFVGKALVLKLLEMDYKVIALDLPNNPEFFSFINNLTTDQQNQVIAEPADITDYPAVEKATEGVQLVFHTAALLNSIAPQSAFQAVNVQGTENICKAATKANVERFVLVSTSDVFGIPGTAEVITEKTPYRSWGEPYADTKIMACNIVKDYSAKGLLNTTIIYPGWVYGPGDRQFFPAIIEMVKDRHAFTWHKSEPYCVDLIYIEDLVTAIAIAAETDMAIGEDYLILDDNTGITPERFFRYIATRLEIKLSIHKIPYTVMYAIAWVSQRLKQKGLISEHLLSTTDVKAFGNNFHFSNKKARECLQWSPTISAEEGLRKAFDWQQALL